MSFVATLTISYDDDGEEDWSFTAADMAKLPEQIQALKADGELYSYALARAVYAEWEALDRYSHISLIDVRLIDRNESHQFSQINIEDGLGCGLDEAPEFLIGPLGAGGMSTTYETIDGEVAAHDLIHDGKPDPSCYNCLGTGKAQGFGQAGTPCHCRYTCERHETTCEPVNA
jgi:hypothetical protein